MNKPELQTRSYYDYTDCASFINEKYNISDNDFWCHQSDYQHNGSYFSINKYTLEDLKDYKKLLAIPFAKAMIEEFGEDAEYYVEW